MCFAEASVSPITYEAGRLNVADASLAGAADLFVLPCEGGLREGEELLVVLREGVGGERLECVGELGLRLVEERALLSGAVGVRWRRCIERQGLHDGRG